ncbi:hypothetical protein ACFQGT_04125 [Natrialbaceae archaeon GCM10025810]|uniref:DUF7344 domain-containing protein n=1 Tax=Halovalidus salilacus TaxID=3075124 RepID=UPI00361752F8
MGPDDDRLPIVDSRTDVIDSTCSLLRNRDRRYALYYLLAQERVPIEELTDVVTGWTRATDFGLADRQLREQVRLELYHQHIPAMQRAGLVRYDPDSGVVAVAECPELVRSFIRLARRMETTDAGRSDSEPYRDAGPGSTPANGS